MLLTGGARPVATFVPLGGTRVQLLTWEVTAPPSPHLPERQFLAPGFVTAWAQAISTDPIFAPILKGAAATIGGAVDCMGQPATPAAARSPSSSAAAYSTARGRGRLTDSACLMVVAFVAGFCTSAATLLWG
jgi:hypothetical protein